MEIFHNRLRGKHATTSTPAASTDTIFTSREYKAETFGTPTYPDATTAKRQILDNDDGTFTIQFLTEDEDIGSITSTIADDVDLTINSAEVQAYQVTKPEIQILTFTAPANPITADSGGKVALEEFNTQLHQELTELQSKQPLMSLISFKCSL